LAGTTPTMRNSSSKRRGLATKFGNNLLREKKWGATKGEFKIQLKAKLGEIPRNVSYQRDSKI